MADHSGCNCLITGASGGIGRATAIALARRGANLWLLCRNRERGQATVDAIRDEIPGSRVELLLADLASLKEVRKAAAEFLALGEPLHVLLNNAGLANMQRRETVDGIEETLAVNHLAPFLLTHLLRERLVESAPARVVTVSSGAHAFGRIDMDDLQRTRKYSGLRVYGESKLANVLFTYELARRLAGTGVTATCLHPGGVRTGLGQQNPNSILKGLGLPSPFLF